MSSFWLVLFSSRILHNGTHCVKFGESCVPAKVAWAIGTPTKHVTFSLSQSQSAHPVRVQELDDDEDDKHLVGPDYTVVSEEEDDATSGATCIQRKAPKRESSAIRRLPAPLRTRKGPPVASICHTARCVRKLAWANRRSLEFVRKFNGEALQNIINRLSHVRNLKDLLLHSSREQLTWTFLERFTTSTNMWWRLVHFKIRRNRDQTDHAWVEWKQKNLEISSSWIMVLQKLETLFWMVLLHIGQHIHVRVPLHQKSFPSFMSGWTHIRWILRRFVHIWPFFILKICRHSIECATSGGFLQDRTLLGQIQLKWVSDWLKGSFRHSWTQLPRIWTRLLCHRWHLPSWCAKQRLWETHR